jgi:hypothetical protein
VGDSVSESEEEEIQEPKQKHSVKQQPAKKLMKKTTPTKTNTQRSVTNTKKRKPTKGQYNPKKKMQRRK